MRRKILIIDDEPTLIDFLKIRLEANKYEVSWAFNGADGLEKLKKDMPDLIILDILMPEMDGFTFVQELKRIPEADGIPVLILTAMDKMQDLFKMEGHYDYIVKPFEKEDLLQRIEERIQGLTGDTKDKKT